jgi:hypothetical protein
MISSPRQQGDRTPVRSTMDGGRSVPSIDGRTSTRRRASSISWSIGHRRSSGPALPLQDGDAGIGQLARTAQRI